MKIERFLAAAVHGYLSLDVPFFPDITFLTGINGSGKTTVVNGVSALISPSLSLLASMKYDRMQVDFEEDGQRLSIWATREEDKLSLQSSLDQEALEIPVLRAEELTTPHAAERIRDYYREQEARYSPHPVLKRLKALPTPMVLGLERRSLSNPFFFPEDRHHVAPIPHRRLHNAFSSSLTRSLVEAGALAERSYNQVQALQRELTDELKKQFILSALKYSPASFRRGTAPDLDTQAIARVKATLREIGLSEKEIEANLDPFVDKLRAISKYLPFAEDLQKVMSERESSSEARDKAAAYLEWYTNRPQFERLTKLLRDINGYITRSQQANKPLDTYLEIVNSFLRDSQKQLRFDRTGLLEVLMQGGVARDITALSSGESQLVVILTHLAFNPAAQSANVFIVDEPELSLHLKWQELFVSAVRSLNQNLQIILATHSPAIILDDLEHCVDLSSAVVE